MNPNTPSTEQNNNNNTPATTVEGVVDSATISKDGQAPGLTSNAAQAAEQNVGVDNMLAQNGLAQAPQAGLDDIIAASGDVQSGRESDSDDEKTAKEKAAKENADNAESAENAATDSEPYAADAGELAALQGGAVSEEGDTEAAPDTAGSDGSGTSLLVGLGLLGGLAAAVSSGGSRSTPPPPEPIVLPEEPPLSFIDTPDGDESTFALDSDAVSINAMVDGTGSGKSFAIDAQSAVTIDLVGKLVQGLDDAADVVILTIDDIPTDTRTITLNSAGLLADSTGTGHKLVFDFSGNADFANDVIVLGSDSDISAFSEIEVVAGTVNVLGVLLPAGTIFTVNAGLILSVEQFINTPSIASVTGDGAITITVVSDSDVNKLQVFLETLTNTDKVLIGGNYTIDFDAYTGDLSAAARAEQSSLLVGQLDAITFPFIPEIDAMLVAMQSQISSNDTDIAAVLASAATLKTNVESLEALVGSESVASVTFTALDQLLRLEALVGSESVASVKAGLDNALASAKTALEGKITALDTNLQEKINSNDTDIAGVITAAATLKTNVEALKALVGDESVASVKAALNATIAGPAGRITDLEGPINDWAGLSAIDITAGALFGAALSASAENVLVGFSYDPSGDDQGQEVYLSDLDADGRYTVPAGKEFVTFSDVAVAVGDSGDPTVFNAGDVVTLPLSTLLVLSGPDAPFGVAITQIAFDMAVIDNPELAADFVAPMTVADFLAGGPSRDAGNSIDAVFTDQYDGYNPATVKVNITTALTVAQAVALVEAGFDLATNVTFSIKDFASTIQAAQNSPAQEAVLDNATLVTGDANELDNSIDMAAFNNSVNLRTELNDGNDSFNAGRGDEQIVGGGGADVINLTKNDSSQDAVITKKSPMVKASRSRSSVSPATRLITAKARC